MYVCMCVCVYVYMCVCVHVCMCMCVCVCVYVYVFMCMCVCILLFVCIMCRLQRELFQRTEGTFFGLYCLVFFGFMTFWGPFCRLYRTQPRPIGVYRISTVSLPG